jgi:glycosyltransferase involved in cell wall biosynthesis
MMLIENSGRLSNMNLSNSFTKSLFYLNSIVRRKGYGISILVPFHTTDTNSQRAKNWEWLHKYWKKQLPGAELIMGVDSEVGKDNKPFSKSCAVNDAASKASGDILVIVDADGYISVDSILKCADEIRKARKKKRKLWFIPYRQFYRLTEDASKKILESDPEKSCRYSNKPPDDHVLNTEKFNGLLGSAYGHRYGALIQIMPKEAFELVGGWDERFRGWGGEDYAAMKAMDTLYWPHKTLPSPVFHIWHPFKTVESAKVNIRLWDNQQKGNINGVLSNRYHLAQGNLSAMRKLVNEWKASQKKN